MEKLPSNGILPDSFSVVDAQSDQNALVDVLARSPRPENILIEAADAVRIAVAVFQSKPEKPGSGSGNRTGAEIVESPLKYRG